MDNKKDPGIMRKDKKDKPSQTDVDYEKSSDEKLKKLGRQVEV